MSHIPKHSSSEDLPGLYDGAQTELYVADPEHSFPLSDIQIFKNIVEVAYADRTGRLGAKHGELEALRDNGRLPCSYDLFVQRGLGRYELPVMAECLEAARNRPGLFDFLLRPRGHLGAWLEHKLDKNPELREIGAFVSRPRSSDQDEHVDNTDASRNDYVTLFWATDQVTNKAGGTRFFRNTAALGPTERDALCRRLKKQRLKDRNLSITSTEGETVRLQRCQWLTFSLHTVHFGLANSGFEHPRILGTALWARRGAADLPQNRVLHRLPPKSLRLSPLDRAVIDPFAYVWVSL